jgi:hypothetical protein
MKLKQKISNLKIRERLTKYKIKEKMIKSSKILLPIIFVGFLVYPLDAYAEEITGLANKAGEKTCPNTKLGQAKELGISLIGLKKCLDPCATPLQKVLYCSRPCCILAGITSACVAEKSPVGSKMHAVATACCIASWNTYGLLLVVDRDKTRIKK